MGLGPVYRVISTIYNWVGPKPQDESVVIPKVISFYRTPYSLPPLLPGSFDEIRDAMGQCQIACVLEEKEAAKVSYTCQPPTLNSI